MIKLKSLISETIANEVVKGNYNDGVWYHGSASGDLRGGVTGLHLGTFEAAKQALEARIGIPFEGGWDGKRRYGETLLCGANTLKQRDIFPTGFNCDVPDNDFYSIDNDSPVIEWRKEFHHSFNKNNRPAIKAYHVECPLKNSLKKPYKDEYANQFMARLIKKGIANFGFYYTNIGEDEGSISIVVPNGNFVKEI